jgi:tyrosinase
LGNLIEASEKSLNSKYYGSLHNSMHLFTSMAHDPDDRFKEGGGIMGDTSTAMRDPVFYRVHAFVDSIYNAFKQTLEPYTKAEV